MGDPGKIIPLGPTRTPHLSTAAWPGRREYTDILLSILDQNSGHYNNLEIGMNLMRIKIVAKVSACALVVVAV